VRVRVANWWENDNLLNLDFEGGYRDRGHGPHFWAAPDGWKVWGGHCEPEYSVRRPGAGSGTRSMKLTAADHFAFIVKDLTFLAPGDKVTLAGWARCDPAPGSTSWLHVQIGEGHDYWNAGNGVNKAFNVSADGQWRSFSLEYFVPAPPIKQAFTRLTVVASGAVGNVLFADDITAVISR
jgi:hypothetical protein